MKQLLILLTVVMWASGCSDSNTAMNGNVTLKASTVSTSGKTSITGRVSTDGRVNSTVAITDFKVNIGNIQFDVDELDSRHSSDSVYDDTRLTGPFLIDLLNPDTLLNQVIASVPIPNGRYEEIKFKFEKSTASGEMNGKTFLIKGTVNDTPFVIWSGKDAELEMDFPDSSKDIIISNNTVVLNIKVKIDTLLTTLKELIAQGVLQDTDGDGIIEISTNDDDGHHSIGELIKQLLEDEADLEDHE